MKNRNENKFLKDGIILLNKEKGISSFNAINKLKWILNAKKTGHAGTLDPMAEGLLIVMINNATKFSDDLMKKDKEYYVEMELGYETDTYDAEGTITKKYGYEDIENKIKCNLEHNLLENLSQEEVKEAVMSFVGEIEQLPPMYSAIKVNGEKLYNLARKGLEIERKTRKIKINYITDIKYDKDKKKVSFYVGVSSGTYIRSLVKDIGDKLTTYATMTKLIRTKIDKFLLENDMKLSDSYDDDLKSFYNISHLFEFEEIFITEEEYEKLKNGMTVLVDFKRVKDSKVDKKYKIYLRKKDFSEFKGIIKITKIGTDKVYLKRDKYFL